MENFKELLVGELKDLYSAEKQIVKAFPKIVRGASSPRTQGGDRRTFSGYQGRGHPP